MALPIDDALDSGRGAGAPRLPFGAEGALQWHCFTAMLLLGMLPFVDAEFALTYRPAVMAAVVWVFLALVQWHRWRLWALRVGVALMWALLVGHLALQHDWPWRHRQLWPSVRGALPVVPFLLVLLGTRPSRGPLPRGEWAFAGTMLAVAMLLPQLFREQDFGIGLLQLPLIVYLVLLRRFESSFRAPIFTLVATGLLAMLAVDRFALPDIVHVAFRVPKVVINLAGSADWQYFISPTTPGHEIFLGSWDSDEFSRLASAIRLLEVSQHTASEWTLFLGILAAVSLSSNRRVMLASIGTAALCTLLIIGLPALLLEPGPEAHFFDYYGHQTSAAWGALAAGVLSLLSCARFPGLSTQPRGLTVGLFRLPVLLMVSCLFISWATVRIADLSMMEIEWELSIKPSTAQRENPKRIVSDFVESAYREGATADEVVVAAQKAVKALSRQGAIPKNSGVLHSLEALYRGAPRRGSSIAPLTFTKEHRLELAANSIELRTWMDAHLGGPLLSAGSSTSFSERFFFSHFRDSRELLTSTGRRFSAMNLPAMSPIVTGRVFLPEQVVSSPFARSLFGWPLGKGGPIDFSTTNYMRGSAVLNQIYFVKAVGLYFLFWEEQGRRPATPDEVIDVYGHVCEGRVVEYLSAPFEQYLSYGELSDPPVIFITWRLPDNHELAKYIRSPLDRVHTFLFPLPEDPTAPSPAP